MNLGPQQQPPLHLCLSGDPSCSGCRPCAPCENLVREVVLPVAMRSGGFAGSPQQSLAFFQGYAGGWERLRGAIAGDPGLRAALRVTNAQQAQMQVQPTLNARSPFPQSPFPQAPQEQQALPFQEMQPGGGSPVFIPGIGWVDRRHAEELHHIRQVQAQQAQQQAEIDMRAQEQHMFRPGEQFLESTVDPSPARVPVVLEDTLPTASSVAASPAPSPTPAAPQPSPEALAAAANGAGTVPARVEVRRHVRQEVQARLDESDKGRIAKLAQPMDEEEIAAAAAPVSSSSLETSLETSSLEAPASTPAVLGSVMGPGFVPAAVRAQRGLTDGDAS